MDKIIEVDRKRNDDKLAKKNGKTKKRKTKKEDPLFVDFSEV
jgi:hypothetical protein